MSARTAAMVDVLTDEIGAQQPVCRRSTRCAVETYNLSEQDPPPPTLPVTGGGDQSILVPQQHLTSRARR